MRNEERMLHDLPDSPSTMSAREALVEAMWEALPGYYDSVHSAPAYFAAGLIDELRDRGFVIVPAAASPEPKVT